MSSHVVGYRKKDGRWAEMEAVWAACDAAGLETPEVVLDFFGGEDPFGKPGAEVDIKGAVSEHMGECENGFEVDLEKLPEGLRWIRFVNAY